jgi:tetratricopeptide (TPR) repeat protein
VDEQLVFDPVAYFRQQAQTAMDEGDFRAAVKSYRSAMRHAQTDPVGQTRLMVEMGDAYFEDRAYAKAIGVWHDALGRTETSGDRPWIYWRLAKAHARKRQLDQADALLSEIPSAAMRLDKLLRAQVQVLEGEILRQRRDYTASKRRLRAAIRTALTIHPDDARGVVVTAYEALFETCRMAEDLVGALKVLLEVQPYMEESGDEEELTGPLTDLGITFIRRNRPYYAEQAFAAALDCADDPTTEVYLLSNYASVLCEVNRFDDAYIYIQKAMAYADIDDPQSPEFLATLFDTAAYVCLRRGQLDQARMWIQKALKRLADLPSSPFPVASVYLNLALVEEESGRLDEALMALYQAQAHAPESRHLEREIERMKKRLEGVATKASRRKSRRRHA